MTNDNFLNLSVYKQVASCMLSYFSADGSCGLWYGLICDLDSLDLHKVYMQYVYIL